MDRLLAVVRQQPIQHPPATITLRVLLRRQAWAPAHPPVPSANPPISSQALPRRLMVLAVRPPMVLRLMRPQPTGTKRPRLPMAQLARAALTARRQRVLRPTALLATRLRTERQRVRQDTAHLPIHLRTTRRREPRLRHTACHRLAVHVPTAHARTVHVPMACAQLHQPELMQHLV